MMWILLLLLAVIVGVLLWSVKVYDSACTGDCKQGRECNCLIGKKGDE